MNSTTRHNHDITLPSSRAPPLSNASRRPPLLNSQTPGTSRNRVLGAQSHALSTSSDRGVQCTGTSMGSVARKDVPPTNPRTTSNPGIEREKIEKKKTPKGMGTTIASLNICGKRLHNSREYKFKDLTTLVRKNHILVMGIQETNLTVDEEEGIMRANPKIILVNNPTIGGTRGTQGTGFILNKDLLLGKAWEHEILIQGRASVLTITWNEEQVIQIINVYCPNDSAPKEEFLKILRRKIKNKKDWKKPILMGDFNFVEEQIDRSPQRNDEGVFTNIMRDIRRYLKLEDGWRLSHDKEINFSLFHRSHNSMSRIDRIYIHEERIPFAIDWNIISSAGLSDHNIVTAEILNEKIPEIGKGLWKLDQFTIEYPPFIKKARKALLEYHQFQKGANKRNGSIQKEWHQVKKVIRKEGQNEKKNRRRNLTQKEMEEEAELKTALRQLSELEVSEDTRAEVIRLERKRGKRMNKRNKKLQLASKARFQQEGQKNTKYFFKLGKVRLQRTIIVGMRGIDNKLTTKSNEMAKIASNHHSKLQQTPEQPENHQEIMTEMLANVKECLNNNEKSEFEKEFSIKEIGEALRAAKNDVSPGIDGIPFEFFKKWTQETEFTKEKKQVDIISIMTELYNDIKRNGLIENNFNKGAMILLYKKGDKTKAENYRPITLTNADYKLMTKAIATRLGNNVKNIINIDQAGFVPGRSLFDNTRLSNTMISYCEQTKADGCIIALDQEKAYDRISHVWLWEVLKKFNFPESFIELIKTLYNNAKTVVTVNGILPSPINIMRGVRQGDPMSCLLYNLAIEPLACAIRESTLQGFKIPGLTRRLKVTLFADDTLVYVNRKDNIKTLYDILDKFCAASSARFNASKTEFLPLGSPEYRKKLIDDRRINSLPGGNIAQGIRIVKDKESLRTLGAWIGNGADQFTQWEGILTKQKKSLEIWNAMKLSYRGKELILKAMITSRAMFLATVNGMPTEIIKEMNKMIKDTLWDNKRGLVSWNLAISPREMGGLGIPDIESRIEAIEIMWLKKFLAPEQIRPTWAYPEEHLIKLNVSRDTKIDNTSMRSWGLQRWNEATKAKWCKIPKHIKTMLKVARKYNTGIAAPRFTLEQIRQIPVWYHPGASSAHLENKAGAKELRKKTIHTVGNLNDILEKEGHKTTKGYIKVAHSLKKAWPNKMNPDNDYRTEDGLDHTPQRKARFGNSKSIEGTIPFDPNTEIEGTIENTYRIFQDNATYKKAKTIDDNIMKTPTKRQRKEQIPNKTIYIAGTIVYQNNEQSLGCSIWCPNEANLTKTIRIKNGNMTALRAEIIATIEATTIEGELTIKTSSKQLVEGVLKKTKEWEDNDYTGVENEIEWRTLINKLRQRPWVTNLHWIEPKERGDEFIKTTDLAKKAAKGIENTKEIEGPLMIPLDSTLTVSGIRLCKMTQKLAYTKIISKKSEKIAIPRTKRHLEEAKEEAQRRTGIPITEKQIWQGLYKSNIALKIGDFIWRIIHGRVKCGPFFRHIPGWEDKADCACGSLETIEHIIFECPLNDSRKIWQTTQEIWEVTTAGCQWKSPNIKIIMALGGINLKLDGGRSKNKPATEKYKTLVSETAWMIWKNRNRRVMDEQINTIPILELKEELKNIISEHIRVKWETIQQIPFIRREPRVTEFRETWTGGREVVSITDKNRVRINL